MEAPEDNICSICRYAEQFSNLENEVDSDERGPGDNTTILPDVQCTLCQNKAHLPCLSQYVGALQNEHHLPAGSQIPCFVCHLGVMNWLDSSDFNPLIITPDDHSIPSSQGQANSGGDCCLVVALFIGLLLIALMVASVMVIIFFQIV